MFCLKTIIGGADFRFMILSSLLMKKTEITLISIVVLSAVVRLCVIEGSVFLLTLSCLILALFYLLFSFLLLNRVPFKQMFRADAYTLTSRKSILGSVVVGMALFMMTIGLLFVLNHWEGALIMLKSGLLFMLPVACVSTALCFIKPTPYRIAVLVRCGIAVACGLLVLLFWT